MITIENTEVMGWQHVIRGMRNPLESWDKSDSGIGCDERTLWGNVETGDKLCENCSATYESHAVCSGEEKYIIGPNDHKLMMNLAKGGPVHAKYRRMITVYLDITAPLYWWKEFDTYKTGTVANSCSTMHKIHDKEFTLDDFSCEHLWTVDHSIEDYVAEHMAKEGNCWAVQNPKHVMNIIIGTLNYYREQYLKTKDKKDWWQMIQLLPSSYNQKRTIMLNYEVLHNMYMWRKNHKLDEWREFCKWIESLPYSEIITDNTKTEE